MASAPRIGPGGTGTVELDPVAWEARWNEALVHEVVRAELNAKRQGTASSKTRGEVSGGGAKPWRQKGTGRARAGSSRSPIWTGGGTVFGPQPRHFTFKINRKARRAAFRSALSVHSARGSLAVFDGGDAWDVPSTKNALGMVTDWPRSARGRVLVLLHEVEANAAKSFRNVQRITVLPVEYAGVADIIGAATLVVSERALEDLTARAVGSTREREAI
jgi:large subunit ribosomal protein L4